MQSNPLFNTASKWHPYRMIAGVVQGGGRGCNGTRDIFSCHSGVLTVGSVVATCYRVLHVIECPQKTGKQKWCTGILYEICENTFLRSLIISVWAEFIEVLIYVKLLWFKFLTLAQLKKKLFLWFLLRMKVLKTKLFMIFVNSIHKFYKTI